jgi:hypothetical protein
MDDAQRQEEAELQKLAGKIAVVMLVTGIFTIPMALLLGWAIRVFAWAAKL